MTLTMNKATRATTTAATAMTEYYDEITANAAEIAMEMALAEAMDAALAAIFERQATV